MLRKITNMTIAGFTDLSNMMSKCSVSKATVLLRAEESGDVAWFKMDVDKRDRKIFCCSLVPINNNSVFEGFSFSLAFVIQSLISFRQVNLSVISVQLVVHWWMFFLIIDHKAWIELVQVMTPEEHRCSYKIHISWPSVLYHINMTGSRDAKPKWK